MILRSNLSRNDDPPTTSINGQFPPKACKVRPDPCCLGSGRNSSKASSYSLFYASSGTPKGRNGRETVF